MSSALHFTIETSGRRIRHDRPRGHSPAPLAGDIRNTVIGGSPHPNDKGHTKLANTLSAAFAAL